MKKTFVVVILLFVISAIIFAQPRRQAQQHGFSMRMWINNNGAMGRIAIPSWGSPPGLEYPIGRPYEHLWGAGLWIGGLLDTTRGSGTNPPVKLVTVAFEGWAGPFYEMYPGSSPEDTLYALHNASRQDTIEPPGWYAYWDGALPFRPVSDQDIYYTYTDTAIRPASHIPLRLKIIQSTLAWNEPSGEAIAIVEYKVMNMGTKTIDSAYLGLFAEPYFSSLSEPPYSGYSHYSAYWPEIRTAYARYAPDTIRTPVGFRLLGISQPFHRTTFRWFYGPLTPPTDLGKYALLSSGEIMPDEYPPGLDSRFVLSTGPYFIRPSTAPSPDTLIVAYAVVSGMNLSTMYQNAVRADSLYRTFTTSVEPPHLTIPEKFTLYQNYPNPFNPSTKIRFEVPTSGLVRLKVYNMLGQEVATLVDGIKQPGKYEVTWDAAGMPSGMYFYRISTGSFTETKKMMLVR